MDLVYIWYDDRYRSKVLFSNTPNYAHGLKVKATDRTFMTKFGIKLFNSSYFSEHLMDLVYMLYVDRYRSKILFSNTLDHACGLEVRVTDRTFMLKLTFKFPKVIYFRLFD